MVWWRAKYWGFPKSPRRYVTETLLRFGNELTREAANREQLLWVAALCFLFLDIATTWYGFQMGLRESNQVAIVIFRDYGYPGLVALKTFALAVAYFGWYLLPVTSRFVVPSCLAIPWGLASAYNAILIVTLLVG